MALGLPEALIPWKAVMPDSNRKDRLKLFALDQSYVTHLCYLLLARKLSEMSYTYHRGVGGESRGGLRPGACHQLRLAGGAAADQRLGRAEEDTVESLDCGIDNKLIYGITGGAKKPRSARAATWSAAASTTSAW